MRKFFPERTISYAQLTVAGFLFFALATVYSGKAPALAAAVQKNIEVTNLFYHELQRTVFAAKLSPETPLILDAYGPRSYEAVFSLSYYLSSLGVKNPISVRFHRGEKSEGGFFDSLEQRLSDLQEVGTGVFTPLRESLANRSQGCLSVGIDGPPDPSCSGFHVKGH
jgi:hypothetical protein